jgi:hypothetical protein
MKRRASNSPADRIIRRTLVTSETVIGELRERLAKELASGRLSLRSEIELIDQARTMLAQYEPILAERISSSDLYGWIAGYDATAKKSPSWLLDQAFQSLLEREVLAEDIEEGTSLRGFQAKIEDRLRGLAAKKNGQKKSRRSGPLHCAVRPGSPRTLASARSGPSHRPQCRRIWVVVSCQLSVRAVRAVRGADAGEAEVQVAAAEELAGESGKTGTGRLVDQIQQLASIGSVLASRPIPSAKSLTRRGLTTAKAMLCSCSVSAKQYS